VSLYFGTSIRPDLTLPSLKVISPELNFAKSEIGKISRNNTIFSFKKF
jgi:hypothetical protein